MVASSLLDLIGNTPLVELSARSRRRAARSTRSSRGRTRPARSRTASRSRWSRRPTSSPAQELLEPTSGNTGISLALVAKLHGTEADVRDAVERDAGAPARCSSCTARRSSTRPASRARTAPCGWRRRSPPRDDRVHDALPVRERGEPARALRGHGAEIVRDLPRVDALVAGLGTGGTLMGTGARVREAFPDVQVVAARAAARRSGDGPALARGRLRAADPRRLAARPQAARLERRGGRRGRARCSSARGIFAGVSAGAVVHVARRIADELPEGSVVVAVLADGGWKYLSAPFWERRGDRRGGALVVVPAAIRAELRAHAAEEAPNECCGVLVFRDGVAERYIRGRNRSPRRTATSSRSTRGLVPRGRGLRARGLPLAPRDRAASRRAPTASSPGLWAGRPFLIYGLELDELRAWRITRDERRRAAPLDGLAS